MTEARFASRLAEGVIQEAAQGRLGVVETVEALAKCQTMAIKVKAANMLRKTGTDDVHSMREFVQSLMQEESV